ncbi:MAG: TRAP transporter small permease subunit [Sphaerochaetaceae bacterium]|nr:TRAP transporter small permease subunit [Sphaerochaetaceae bacterium]
MLKSDVIWKIISGVLFATVGGMLVVIVIQVLGRMVGQSIPWTEELIRYLFLWTVNFGMAVGMRHANHASVNILYLVLPRKKWIEVVHLVIYTASAFVFFSLLSYWNYGMTMRQLRSGEISPALEIPMFLVSLPLFMCDLLAVVGLAQSMFLDMKTRERVSSCDQGEASDIIEEARV